MACHGPLVVAGRQQIVNHRRSPGILECLRYPLVRAGANASASPIPRIEQAVIDADQRAQRICEPGCDARGTRRASSWRRELLANKGLSD